MDNLIAVCINCHVDVHSKVPFMRRFSVEELKLHRNRVYDMVKAGLLQGHDANVQDGDEAFDRQVRAGTVSGQGLSSLAIRLLCSAVEGSGQVGVTALFGGSHRISGKDTWEVTSHREWMEHRDALNDLVMRGLVNQRGNPPLSEHYDVTTKGYQCYDDIKSMHGLAPEGRV